MEVLEEFLKMFAIPFLFKDKVGPQFVLESLNNGILDFPHSSVGKESTCNAGDPGFIHGSGRCPGKGNGNPLQYSCLENSMDRGAWRAIVHGVARVEHDSVTKPQQHFRPNQHLHYYCYQSESW